MGLVPAIRSFGPGVTPTGKLTDRRSGQAPARLARRSDRPGREPPHARRMRILHVVGARPTSSRRRRSSGHWRGARSRPSCIPASTTTPPCRRCSSTSSTCPPRRRAGRGARLAHRADRPHAAGPGPALRPVPARGVHGLRGRHLDSGRGARGGAARGPARPRGGGAAVGRPGDAGRAEPGAGRSSG